MKIIIMEILIFDCRFISSCKNGHLEVNDEIYQVKLYCDHNVCINCFVDAYDDNNKCHYKCDGFVDFDNINLLKIH